MFEWFWKLIYNLLVGITGLIDFLLDVFRVLCGMSPVMINEGGANKEVNLLDYFITSKTVYTAFWYVVFIGIGLLFLASVFMMIRIQYNNKDGQHSPGQVVAKAFKSFLLFFMVPIIMIVGVLGVSTIMNQIDKATNPYFDDIASQPTYDDSKKATIGGQILVTIGEKAWEGEHTEEEKAAIRAGFIMREDGYDYLEYNDVKQYYDVSDLDFSIGFLSGLTFLIIFAMSMFTVAERLVNIIVLFIISPMPIAVSVLDDGQRFKLWRDQVLVKFLSCYGVIIALNIYNLMVPVIQSLSFGIPMYGDKSDGMIAFTDGLIKIFLLLGAAFAIKKAPIMIGNLVSQGAGSQEAADNSHSLQNMARIGGMALGAAKIAATPITAPIGAGLGEAKKELTNWAASPFRRASERREKMRQMKSDAKMAKQFQGYLDKEANGEKISRGDKANLDAYRLSKQFNAPDGLKPSAGGNGGADNMNGANNPNADRIRNAASSSLNQRAENPDDGGSTSSEGE